MTGSNLYEFDPQPPAMNFEYRSDNFGFAFNNTIFSDRVLEIEIIPDSIESTSDDVKIQTAEKQDLNQSDHFSDDDVNTGNLNQEPAESIGESPLDGDDPNCVKECSTPKKSITLHISSLILAARSPFFYKLFSNGMKESKQHSVNLKIKASEETAFMELMNFMYSNNLTVTKAPALLDVMMAANKFEVSSCMRYCSLLLSNLPMTLESAQLYLGLPSSELMAEAVMPLTTAAKQFLVVYYKDITRFHDEILKLPLVGVEAIISSDDLYLASEDMICDIVLRWARAHYPDKEERRQIIGTRLAKHIRFPYMTCRNLKKVMTCTDFDPEFAQKVVIEALFFKAEPPYKQRAYINDENYNINRQFVERAHKYWPVKVVEFVQPHPQCVVYLDIKREQCENLFPSGRVYSQVFHLSGQGFMLSARCNIDQQSELQFPCFGLFLRMQERKSVSIVIDYDFSARLNTTEQFVSNHRGTCAFTGDNAVGFPNLFGIPWSLFMREDSVYFLNGVLHLRVELTLRKMRN